MTVTNDGMIVKTTYLHKELHITCVWVCVYFETYFKVSEKNSHGHFRVHNLKL